MASGVLVMGGASLLAAGLCGWAAYRVSRRTYSTMSRPAGRAFAWWWVLVAAILANDGLRALLGLFGDPPVGPYLALAILKIVTMAAALTALGSYILYLWTGHMRYAPAVGFAAFVHAAWFLSRMVARLPADVVVGDWTPRLVLQQSTGVLPPALQALAFFAPGIVLAVAYAAMWWRLQTTAHRLRMVSVFAGLLVLSVVGSIQFSPETPPDSPLFPVFATLTVLAGAAAVAGTRRGGARAEVRRDGAARPAKRSS